MNSRTMILALLAAAAPLAALGQGGPPNAAAVQAQMEATVAGYVFHPAITTFDRPEGQVKGASLTVTSETLGEAGEIPLKVTGPPPEGRSVSPQVSWTKGPPGTKSYALFYEDGAANRSRLGVMHWLAFNIPADVTSLPEGVSERGKGLRRPIGTMKEGANIDNAVSYTGMGGGPVGGNYHLQIFALDKLIDLPSGAMRDEVWEAMEGHVLAAGQHWSYYRAPPPANPPEPGSAAAVAASMADVMTAARAMYLPTALTIHRPPGQPLASTLQVSSSALTRFGATGMISARYSAATGIMLGLSVSPELVWSKGPATTRSYVAMVEDNYANLNREPLLYWLAYDIPASTTRLAEGAAAKPAAFKQGLNKDGRPTYVGMAPPPGAPAFNYHFEVFALDKPLGLPAGATRAQVWEAMKGHVVAKGQTLGFFQSAATVQAAQPAPRGK